MNFVNGRFISPVLIFKSNYFLTEILELKNRSHGAKKTSRRRFLNIIFNDQPS